MSLAQLFNLNEADSTVLLDIRSPDDFAQEHYPGALNISLSPSLAFWAKLFIPVKSTIILIGENSEQLEIAAQLLAQVGFIKTSNKILWQDISQDAKQSTSFNLLTVHELAEKLDSTSDLQLIDVRTEEEWKSGHISQARHIDLRQLLDELSTLSKDKEVIFLCASGNRSSIAASLLLKQGKWKVANVKGGMQAWQTHRLPVI